MKTFFSSMLGTIVGIIVSFILIFIILFVMITTVVSSSKKKAVVQLVPHTVLRVDLDRSIKERTPENPFGKFDLGSQNKDNLKAIGLNTIIKDIEKAKTDSNIAGIYLEPAMPRTGIATIEAIRNALLDFKKSGKFIVSYGIGYSQAAYYLASTATKVYMYPQGDMQLKGLSAQVTFFKGAMDKLGITMQIFRHGKFKSAVEPFDLYKMSPANRKQTRVYLDAIWGHMLQGIADVRHLSVQQLNVMTDSLLVQTGKDALKQGLIDGLRYPDELNDEMKMMAKEKGRLHLVSLSQYSHVRGGRPFVMTNNRIAVVYAVGDIKSGWGNDETIGADRIVKALEKARTDERVKAVVFRVNSPGGSALASDMIWREVTRVKKDKPLIVSMSDLAASGGYYISCAANEIVAEPNTITGSIGVFGLIPNAKKLLNDKLGITVDTVNTNTHSDMGSIFRPVTAREGAVIQQGVEDVYKTFLTRVAHGRHMTVAEVDSIGQGRVWAGSDAIRIGLVDTLGGLKTALKIAAADAHIKHYQVLELPEMMNPFEQIVQGFSKGLENRVLKDKLGDQYGLYTQVKDMASWKGIQARMPYNVRIN